MRRNWLDTAPIHTLSFSIDVELRGAGITLQVGVEEEGIARHSGRPHSLDRNYEEHCALHRADRRSENFEENLQVDVTMHAAKFSIERPSIPAHPSPGPVSNLANRVENKKVAGWRVWKLVYCI
jgi:hypothetical protein